MKRKIAAAFLLATLLSSTAQAASFNCRMATRADEILICQDPELSALDEQMASLFFELRNKLSGSDRAALETDQDAWLESRFQCGRDRDCIESQYRERIEQLEDYQSNTQ
jgi:uncharacterized protein